MLRTLGNVPPPTPGVMAHYIVPGDKHNGMTALQSLSMREIPFDSSFAWRAEGPRGHRVNSLAQFRFKSLYTQKWTGLVAVDLAF